MIVKMGASRNAKAAITYIAAEEKATLKIAMNLNDAEDFAVQMERMEQLWGKNKGNARQAYHLKFCFNPKDDVRNGGILTDSLAMRVAIRIIKETCLDHQVVLAVHNDTPNKHVHAVIGAVNMMNGKKLNMNMEAYRQLKDRASEIAAEYGLTTIDWRDAVRRKRSAERQSELPESFCFVEQRMHQHAKETWKDELRHIIDAAVIGSKSMDEFRKKLAKGNVTLTRCSSDVISYKLRDHRAVRGDTLGGDYTRWAIQDALSHNSSRSDTDISAEDRRLYWVWGRMAGVRRSEIAAICDELPQATWLQKQAVWTDYMQIKNEFWADYRLNKAKLKYKADVAYRRRNQVKEVEWLLSPFNRRRCLAGIIFAAVIRHRYGNREQIEQEIAELHEMQMQLRRESRNFMELSDKALQILRQKGLALDAYLENVWQMQEIAEGMFQQPTEEMAMLWQIEKNARVEDPSLAEFLKMIEEEQNSIRKQEERKNEKESVHGNWSVDGRGSD